MLTPKSEKMPDTAMPSLGKRSIKQAKRLKSAAPLNAASKPRWASL